MSAIFGFLAALSLALTLWQWTAARRFPLHQRSTGSSTAAVTLLKPLKGCDAATESCLKSWFEQVYPGQIQLLFGVASGKDPVCDIVRRLCAEYPKVDAHLIVCGPLLGTNLKVSKLIQMFEAAKHELLVISDADVLVPPDFLMNVLSSLQQPEVGLVNCFYRLMNPVTLAMEWEAIAINADFWSQVLQSESLKPLDFALGAVMATRRQLVQEIGGFEALLNCLADDYQLGNRIARHGHRIVISPIVVQCWSEPMGWSAVWKHQLRWARTIRVCQPWPYFLSVLSNATLWPLVLVATHPTTNALIFATLCWFLRIWSALSLQARLTQSPPRLLSAWLVPVKDLVQVGIWLLAFLGNRIEWRGERLQLRRDGTLVRG